VRHEPLFPISTLPRAPARTGKRRPILLAATGRRRNRSLLPLTNDAPSPSSATHATDRERRSAALPQPPAPSAHSNHISVRRRSGFLHVAVSKAPTSQPSVRDQSVMWALQIQPKDLSGVIRGPIALERQPRTGVAFKEREGRTRFADRVEAHLCCSQFSETSFCLRSGHRALTERSSHVRTTSLRVSSSVEAKPSSS
jgi:hypothetical protein